MFGRFISKQAQATRGGVMHHAKWYLGATSLHIWSDCPCNKFITASRCQENGFWKQLCLDICIHFRQVHANCQHHHARPILSIEDSDSPNHKLIADITNYRILLDLIVNKIQRESIEASLSYQSDPLMYRLYMVEGTPCPPAYMAYINRCQFDSS